ncbi:MAG: 3-5 exoribonuclease [Acidobacteriota bacterium]
MLNAAFRTSTIREMSRLPSINKLDESSSGWSFFLCARKELRTGRDGGDFLSVVLQDVSGQIDAKIFEDVANLEQEFDAGEFVKVQGHGNRHRDRLELVLEKIRRVNAAQDRLDGFREEECVPCAPRPAEEMWAALEGRVARVSNPWVRELLTGLLVQHRDRLLVWPAALTVHHAYRAGLLEHVLKLAEVGELLARAYDADADLLLAAAILHDLGKLEELTYDGATAYSTRGNLIGHITLGAQMMRDAVRQIPGFPEEVQTRIAHLIVSHHGAREHGSPVEPMSVEAFIFSAMDDLDATLHQVRRHMHDDRRDGDFTSYHPRLGRVLLKPDAR